LIAGRRRLNTPGHFLSLKHQENRVANDRFHLGLFDTCPRIDTTRRIAPV